MICTAFWNLVLRRMLILASKDDLVLWRFGFFFSVLSFQMLWRVLLMSHTNGSWRLSSISLRSRSATWWGCSWGTWTRSTVISQDDTSELWGQVMRVWVRSADTCWVQIEQLGLFVFFILSRKSLSCVGRRLWRSRNRKVFSVGFRPCKLASLHTVGQSTSGCFNSALQAFKVLVPSAFLIIVTLFSINTLYHIPDFMVEMFNRPSSLTSRIRAKTSSVMYGYLPGSGMSLLWRMFHW